MFDEKLIDALDSVTWYNCYAEKVLGLIKYGDAILNDGKSVIICPFDDIKNNMGLTVIWMILVDVFGDYGTSPRTGWIEKEKWNECKNFIFKITETYREEEANNG